MTMIDSKKTRHMTIDGTFTGAADLTDMWFRICFFPQIQLSGTEGSYHIKYQGDWDNGQYVLGLVIESVRKAKADCHLEVSAVYED